MVLGLHLKDMWGYPMWCFIGLFLLAEVVGRSPGRLSAVPRGSRLIILIATPVVFIAQQTVGGGFVRQPLRVGVSRTRAGARRRGALAC